MCIVGLLVDGENFEVAVTRQCAVTRDNTPTRGRPARFLFQDRAPYGAGLGRRGIADAIGQLVLSLNGSRIVSQIGDGITGYL